MTTKLVIRGHSLVALLQDPNSPVAADLNRRGQRVLREAQARCPVDTGKLRRSIYMIEAVRGPDGELSVIIGAGSEVPYATYVHEGRGPIRARPGGVLGPMTLGGRPGQFRRSVGPAQGQPFLRDALDAFK